MPKNRSDDGFDGLDTLEDVLVERHENPRRRLTRLVKQLNKVKGPRKKPTW